MARTIITLSKFVGTVGLGLMTGLSYGLSTITLPSLLLLPSAPSAHASFEKLQSSTTLHSRVLSAVSFSGLVLAYIMSPSRGKHPYLLWTALLVGIDQGAELFASKKAEAARNRQLPVAEEDINGEQVRNAIEQWKISRAINATVSGLAFAMSVVGIWGDGF